MEASENEIITVEEYFTLLSKTEELTPKEIMQKKIFEDFITRCEENSSLISPATESIYAEYKRKLASLVAKENPTPQEVTVITDFREKMESQEMNQEASYTRKLDKAGYVSATVVLVILLNIGFIVAMALLGNH